LNLTSAVQEKYFAAFRAAWLPEVPGEFSVVAWHQVVPNSTLAETARFIRAFDRVAARNAWQTAAYRKAPLIAQLKYPEVCFFSAWDFHLPPGGGFQLVEFNDNGSGFLFAAIINALYHEAAGLRRDKRIVAPPCLRLFCEQIGDLVEQEAKSFFEELPKDLFLILDDAESLDHGEFRNEIWLLRDLFQQRGWRAELAGPAEPCCASPPVNSMASKRPLASASAWIFVLRLLLSGQSPAFAPPLSTCCRAVCLDVRGVDHLRLRRSPFPGEWPGTDFPRPRAPPSARNGYRSLSAGRTQAGNRTTAFEHMYDPADNPAIIHPLLAPDIPWQMRFDPAPLLVRRPKQPAAPKAHPFVAKESLSHCQGKKIIEFQP
jgi:hypothetical protein